MNEEEMFEQLNDLINDRNSLIGSDEETNVIYKKDIQALKQVIKGYKEFNLELSGYRKAILQDKEMLGLKEQLQQKENIINKAKEYIKENTVGKKYGEEYYIDEFDRFAIPSGLIEILDNKGE